MDWEQKLAAINALSECSLAMRKPGDWYVTGRRIEIAGDGLLTSPTQCAKTPEGAVLEYWQQIVNDLPRSHYLLVGDHGHTKAVRWNGFMWGDASHLRKSLIQKASQLTERPPNGVNSSNPDRGGSDRRDHEPEGIAPSVGQRGHRNPARDTSHDGRPR